MPENTNIKIKEIAHSVDSCGTLPVLLRDDKLYCHPEFNSGSINGERSEHIEEISDISPENLSYNSKSKSALQPELIDSGSEAGMTCNNSETNALPNNVKNLFTDSLITLFTSHKAAFTLAEVLITLAIIGVVAALTIPGLIQNHNEKAWSTAKDLWEKKLTETVRRMNTDGVMTGHNTTESFMDSFKQYVKVIKSCDNSDLNKCYSPKVVTTGKKGDEIEVTTSDLKTAQSMGIKDWGTNTESFVIADGTTVILAYNPDCPYADPIEDQGSQLSCLGMMIDVNGKKGPNRVGKDIKLTEGVSFSTCDNPIGDMCWSTDFAPSPLDTTLDENKKYDDVYAHKTNYWAGAKKTCADKGMSLPTMAQLAQLASTIYGTEISDPYEDYDNLSLQDDYKNALTFGYSYWSSEQSPSYDNGAYRRSFGTTGSIWGNGSKLVSANRAVCVGS